MPTEYEQVLDEEYVDRFKDLKVNDSDILAGIEKKYSEKILSKLLINCDKVDAYTVRLAIEMQHPSFSEDFVNELLNKCHAPLVAHHVLQAFGKYSLNFIKKVNSKVNPQEPCKFSADFVRYAMNFVGKDRPQKYDEKLIDFLVSKVEENDLTQCLEYIIKYGSADPYEALIERYLPKASATFGRYAFHHLILHGYSEEFILKIYSLTVPEAINAITIKDLLLTAQDGNLDGAMNLYSSKIINLFLKKDDEYKKMDPRYINIALDKKYPEDVLANLVDLIATVNLQDIKRAKQMNYSQALIQKMEAKCEERESCVVQ